METDWDTNTPMNPQLIESTQVELSQLPENHCSLCFKINHTKMNCNYCSDCSEQGHYRKDCPESPFKTNHQININVIKTKTMKNSYVKERRLRRRELRAAYGSKPWWKNINNPITEDLEKYVPIGPKKNKKETLAVDIEGDGHGGVDSVHLSGWFGNIIRIQTVYYAQVKNDRVINPLTQITGLQINDLANGLSLDEVSMQVAEIARGRRLITQGEDDLLKLQLNSERLKVYNIQHVDLQDLWPGRKPIGLVSLDKFLFHDYQKLRREDTSHVTIGHSTERDARVTLKAYIQVLKLKENNIDIPSAEVVREMVKNGQTIQHWIEYAQDEIIMLD